MRVRVWDRRHRRRRRRCACRKQNRFEHARGGGGGFSGRRRRVSVELTGSRRSSHRGRPRSSRIVSRRTTKRATSAVTGRLDIRLLNWTEFRTGLRLRFRSRGVARIVCSLLRFDSRDGAVLGLVRMRRDEAVARWIPRPDLFFGGERATMRKVFRTRMSTSADGTSEREAKRRT